MFMSKKATYSFSLFIKIIIFLVFLFARTFTGFTIFGFRLGEYFIAGSFTLLIIFLLLFQFIKKNIF